MYRERYPYLMPSGLGYGLSLCVQGTWLNRYVGRRLFRFIPVYTGNIVKLIGLSGLPTVYPCVYREHSLRCLVKSQKTGLSLCIQGTYPRPID